MNPSFQKISQNKYRLQKTSENQVEAIFYAKKEMLSKVQEDRSLGQLSDAASLPDVVPPVIGMPDIHEGYGVPIGGVVATNNLISAGAVGMDINCGVRLLFSNLTFDEEKFNQDKLRDLVYQIEHLVPVGLGGRRKTRKLNLEMREVTERGIDFLICKGFANEDDKNHTEEYGCLKGAQYKNLSPHAVHRAKNQLGTLGSGNHFIEIQKIKQVFAPEIAEKWGLFENQVCVMIHTGSRALGHQTCTEFIKIFWNVRKKYNIDPPNRELACLPLTAKEAQEYFSAMKACVNFAFCNRQIIGYFVEKVFEKNFGVDLKLLYDVAHNIAKREEHHGQRLLIHRKGATRALPARHAQNPDIYKETGHPAIVPGSMGTASYVMVGLPKNAETFHSINHGSGRIMSRKQAKKRLTREEFEKLMGNIVYNKPFHVIADEAPGAYKDIHEVIDTLAEIDLTRKVVQLVPLAVIKGN